MYDPEASFERERLKNEISSLVEEAKGLMDNPQLIELLDYVDRGTETLLELVNEYESCYDEEEKKQIATRATELKALIKDTCHFMQAYIDKGEIK